MQLEAAIAQVSRLPLELAPECSLWCQRQLTRKQTLGGHYDSGNFVATTEGIIALCEGLKGSSVTSLECAAKPQVFAFVSAPVDTLSL